MSVMGGGWAPRGLAVLALILLNACVATGVGVDGAVGVDYDAGYYEPWGYDYGGWGHGYRVGPGRGDDHLHLVAPDQMGGVVHHHHVPLGEVADGLTGLATGLHEIDDELLARGVVGGELGFAKGQCLFVEL